MPHRLCHSCTGSQDHGISHDTISRDNLGETRQPSGGIIDAGRGLGKALIDAERQSVFGLLCFLDCRVGWWPAATALSIEGLAATIALDIHLQNRGVMDKAINSGKRHSLVGEDLAPFSKWLIGRD